MIAKAGLHTIERTLNKAFFSPFNARKWASTRFLHSLYMDFGGLSVFNS